MDMCKRSEWSNSNKKLLLPLMNADTYVADTSYIDIIFPSKIKFTVCVKEGSVWGVGNCPVYQPPERGGHSLITYNGTNEHVNE